jgi:hypothetical protein
MSSWKRWHIDWLAEIASPEHSTTKAVALSSRLAARADNETGILPTLVTARQLGEEIGADVKTVRAAFLELQNAGHLVTQRFRDGTAVCLLDSDTRFGPGVIPLPEVTSGPVRKWSHSLSGIRTRNHALSGPGENGLPEETSRPVPIETSAQVSSESAHNSAHADSVVTPIRTTTKFRGKSVPPARLDLARTLLIDFNDKFGTNYKPTSATGKPTDALSRILGALTDNPDITLDEGRRIHIAVHAGDHYWGATAQPGNAWGPGVIEKHRQAATHGPSSKDDLLRMALR